MKKLLLIIALLPLNLLYAQEADIKKSIQTFFEGMHIADTLKIQSVCSADLVLHSVSENIKGAKLNKEGASWFYKLIASLPANTKIEERLLSYKIQFDGAMAHAWTPYEFYINGKLSHKGVNSFQLFKDNGVWKIVYIMDTRRK